MTTNKESFVFYKDWWNAIGSLPQEVRGEVCESIIRYAFGESVAELGCMAAMAMRFVAPQIDRDRAKYEARCEKNRKNGALGGRTRSDAPQTDASDGERTQANASECLQSLPNASEQKQTLIDGNRMLPNVSVGKRTGCDNDNEDDNENENVNDNENENVCECVCEHENETVHAQMPASASVRTHAPAHTPEEKELFSKFQSWLTVCAPTVLLFEEPLKIGQFLWLCNTYGAERLKQCAADIHNKNAYMRNRNALNTFKSWIRLVKV